MKMSLGHRALFALFDGAAAVQRRLAARRASGAPERRVKRVHAGRVVAVVAASALLVVIGNSVLSAPSDGEMIFIPPVEGAVDYNEQTVLEVELLVGDLAVEGRISVAR